MKFPTLLTRNRRQKRSDNGTEAPRIPPRLMLQTPPQQDHTDLLVELDPIQLGASLDQLPLINLRNSLRQVRDWLLPTNQQPVPPRTRFQLLERFRATAMQLEPAIEDAELAKLPLRSGEYPVVKEDMRLILKGLADGYKLLVKALYPHPEQEGRLLAPALYRALEAICSSLLLAFRNNLNIEPFSYLELHQLYSALEAFGWEEEPAVWRNQPLGKLSARHLYTRIMVLGITDPFHLETGQASRFFETITRHLALCRLERSEEIAPPEGCFLIDLSSDSPALPRGRLQTPPAPGQLRLLDLRQLLRGLQGSRHGGQERRPHPTPEELAETALLQALWPRIQRTLKRKEPRRAHEEQVHCAFGAASLGYYLEKGPDFILDAISGGTAGIHVRDLESEQEGEFNLFPGRILNQSQSGLLVAIDGHAPPNTHAGELITLFRTRRRGEPEPLMAEIRWLKQLPDRAEAGVRILTGVPVAARFSPGEESPPLPALFIPPLAALEIPETLVVPAGLLAPGQSGDLKVGETSWRKVRLDGLHHATGCYERYILEESPEEPRVAGGGSPATREAEDNVIEWE